MRTIFELQLKAFKPSTIVFRIMEALLRITQAAWPKAD